MADKVKCKWFCVPLVTSFQLFLSFCDRHVWGTREQEWNGGA